MAAIPVPAAWRRRSRSLAGPLADASGWLAGRFLSVLPTVPGLGGAGAVTYGLAVIAHSAWHWLPALPVGLAVGGVFALLLDRRI